MKHTLRLCLKVYGGTDIYENCALVYDVLAYLVLYLRGKWVFGSLQYVLSRVYFTLVWLHITL